MDRASSMLVLDIGKAASTEAMRSAVLKVEPLPVGLKVPALAIALHLVSIKAITLRRVVPGIDEIFTVLDQLQGSDEAALRARLEGFDLRSFG